MSVSYKVVVQAGGHTWIVTNAEDPDYGLMDGLQITRSVPEGDVSPGQPAPATAHFGIVAETVGDIIPDLDIKTPVWIAVLFPSTGDYTNSEVFAGRITDIDVVPHPNGVLINFVAVDYLADLAELPDYAPASLAGVDFIANRVDALFSAYGAPSPARLALNGHYYDGGGFYTTDGPYSWIADGPFLDVLEVYLREWAFLGGPIVGRYVIAPQVDLGAQAISGYVLMPVALPTAQRSYRTFEIAAAKVDVVGSFSRTKADAVDVLDVTYYTGAGFGVRGPAAVASAGSGPLRTSLETYLTESSGSADAQLIANTFLPTPDADWRVDSFTWHLKAEPEGTYLPSPTPQIPGSYLGGPVDIVGLDPRWSPLGTTYRGILAGYTLTLQKAKPTVQLDLRDALA